MTDEASFLAAIAENSQDTNLPLIFADWLDDQGDPRGQWIRNWSVRHWMGPKLENPIPKLLEAIKKDRRIMCVRRCAEIIGEPLVPGLIELLKHEKPRVRLLVCHCLRKIGARAKPAVPALMAALSDSDYSVREQAAKAVAEIGADETASTEQLKAALTDENWSVRRTASKVLGAMGAKGSVLDELVERYESPDPKDRADVVESLAQLGTVDVIPHLDKALDDPEAAVRVDAVRALGRLTHAGAAVPLCRAMRSTDAAVREDAAEQFVGYSRNVPCSDEVRGALVVLLNDRSDRVRAAACHAVQYAGHTNAAMPGLMKNLEHDAPSVRTTATRALGSITRDNPTSIAAITKLIADSDWGVATNAVGALAEQRKLPVAVVAPLFAFIRRARADEGAEYAVASAYSAFGKLESPPPEVIDELRQALTPPQNNHTDHSWAAAAALMQLGPAAAPATQELLTAVRENRLTDNATQALLAIGGPALDGLIAIFDSHEEDVRHNAINLLWRVGSAGLPLVPAIIRCMRRTADDWRRSRAIYGIQYIGPTATEAIPALLEYLTTPGSQTSYAALSTLTRFESALVPYLPRLVEVASNPAHENWRGTFAELFANLAVYTPAVLEPLRELLRAAMPVESDATNWNTRWWKKGARQQVLRGFATLRAAAVVAITDIASLIADPEVEIRRAVPNVLGVLDTPTATPLLCRALVDADEVVRFRAAEGLAGQGDTSDETVAALVHAVSDRDAKVRRAAIDTLNRLKASTDAVRAALSEATNDDDKKVAERAAVALRKATPKATKVKAEPKVKTPRAKGKKAE